MTCGEHLTQFPIWEFLLGGIPGPVTARKKMCVGGKQISGETSRHRDKREVVTDHGRRYKSRKGAQKVHLSPLQRIVRSTSFLPHTLTGQISTVGTFVSP